MKEYEAKLLAARGFDSLADYEEARSGPWRDAVQARALEVAHETLARAIRSARGLNHAMSDDRLAAALFEQLRPLRAGGASTASAPLLRSYPFLANPKAWGYAMKATGPAELQWYLGYYVLSMLRGAEEIDERLSRHPDRVMQWDAVVQAALSEMGIAADSPQAAFIARGIGHAPDTSFLHQLEEIDDFALYFVPGVGEAKAMGNFLDASSDYDTGRVEASLELRGEDPSVVPVILSLAAVALPLGGSKVLGKVAKPLTEAFGGAGEWLTKVLGRGAEAIEAEAPQAARSVVPHVESQLADLEQSMAKEKLPEDYTRVLEHLDAQPPGPAVDSFRRALPIAMEALRTPRLYGEVLDEVMARMARNGTTFEQELRAMAAGVGTHMEDNQGRAVLAGLLGAVREPARRHQRPRTGEGSARPVDAHHSGPGRPPGAARCRQAGTRRAGDDRRVPQADGIAGDRRRGGGAPQRGAADHENTARRRGLAGHLRQLRVGGSDAAARADRTVAEAGTGRLPRGQARRCSAEVTGAAAVQPGSRSSATTQPSLRARVIWSSRVRPSRSQLDHSRIDR